MSEDFGEEYAFFHQFYFGVPGNVTDQDLNDLTDTKKNIFIQVSIFALIVQKHVEYHVQT